MRVGKCKVEQSLAGNDGLVRTVIVVMRGDFAGGIGQKPHFADIKYAQHCQAGKVLAVIAEARVRES